MKNPVLGQVDNQLSANREKFGDERGIMLRSAMYQQAYLRTIPDRPLRAQDAVAFQIMEKLAKLETTNDYQSVFVEIATIAATGASIIPAEKERMQHLSSILGVSSKDKDVA